MTGKHASVALFVPHIGCPHRCIFCDQRAISGEMGIPRAQDVRQAAETALRSLGERAKTAEIAFFGGSFTAIPRAYMMELLEAATPYVRDGRFAGIRLSTRPDAISEEILELLQTYGVTAIELGAQSMDDGVLQKNGRGHSAEDVCRASAAIRNAGFSLGLQMMTGLYGSNETCDRQTAQKLAAMRPDTVRIYPTTVMRQTELEWLYRTGLYTPPTLEETVRLCAELQDFFEENGIRVIRTGLHSGGNVEENMVAGPFHPAFGELCMGERMRRRIKTELARQGVVSGSAVVVTAPQDRSAAVGQKKCNQIYFEQQGVFLTFRSDSAQPRGTVAIEISQ